MDDINDKIIPFFTKYILRAKKKSDFELWFKAAKIIHNRKLHQAPFTEKEHSKLLYLREQMRTYKAVLNRGYKNRPI